MLQRTLVVLALAGASLLSSGYAIADDQASMPPGAREQKQIRGSQMMTPEERAEHHKEMRKARTREEREKVRKEQHERMKERAKEHGKTMPDQPPERGQGMGPGGGMGPRDGTGPRNGMGLGGNSNR